MSNIIQIFLKKFSVMNLILGAPPFVIDIFWKLQFLNHFIFLNDVQFLTTFTQLNARLKNFLRGWLLVLSLKEGLVECATVCVKSEVILSHTVPMCFQMTVQQKFRLDHHKFPHSLIQYRAVSCPLDYLLFRLPVLF